MASSGLKGPHTLSADGVDRAVTKTSAGAYALGCVDTQNTFAISYVGRSDNDIGKRLKDHIGKYKQFKFDYFGSPKAAFEKECNLYHDFGETALDNNIHPARPADSDWKCPRCKTFD